MTPEEREELRRLAEKATPGPWEWNVNLKSKSVELRGHPRRMRETVMGFDRWGMNLAQPLFNVDGLLVDVSELAAIVPGREHHADWFRTIEHPDADFIAASREAIPALLADLDAKDAEIARLLAVESAARAFWIAHRGAEIFLPSGGGQGYQESHERLTAALAAIAPMETPESL